MSKSYCTATLFDGQRDIPVFVELSQRQMYEADDCWFEERVDCFEDRDGQVIPYFQVLISDLDDIRPEQPWRY